MRLAIIGGQITIVPCNQLIHKDITFKILFLTGLVQEPACKSPTTISPGEADSDQLRVGRQDLEQPKEEDGQQQPALWQLLQPHSEDMSFSTNSSRSLLTFSFLQPPPTGGYIKSESRSPGVLVSTAPADSSSSSRVGIGLPPGYPSPAITPGSSHSEQVGSLFISKIV